MLASKGGNNPNQITHHITRSLMTDELMLSFTMKGQTGKEAFKDFIFLDCICGEITFSCNFSFSFYDFLIYPKIYLKI